MYQDDVRMLDGQLVSDGWLAWTLSPDDPDQTNGALNYTYYMNTTNPGTLTCSTATGSATQCGWLAINITAGAYTPIAERSGWVKIPTTFTFASGSLPACNENSNFSYECAFNMTAHSEDGLEEGNPSCNISLRIDIDESRSQCGNIPLAAPAGIAAKTFVVSTNETEGIIQAKWPLSEDDPNSTVGNLTYRVIGSATSENGDSFILFNQTDPYSASLDLPGVRVFNESLGGTARYLLTFQARAEDPYNYLISNWTCSATVNTGLENDQNSCNGASLYTGSYGRDGEALFPITNPDDFATLTGLPVEASYWLFGAIWILFCAGIGAYILGLWGGIGGSTIGFASTAILGLYPYWLVVVVFAVAVAIIVLFNSKKGSA